jgi:hypothetical protein
MIRLNPKWVESIAVEIKDGKDIDITLSILAAKVHVVTTLTQAQRPFKVYNMGCGVTRITTETKICPCCKKEL